MEEEQVDIDDATRRRRLLSVSFQSYHYQAKNNTRGFCSVPQGLTEASCPKLIVQPTLFVFLPNVNHNFFLIRAFFFVDVHFGLDLPTRVTRASRPYVRPLERCLPSSFLSPSEL